MMRITPSRLLLLLLLLLPLLALSKTVSAASTTTSIACAPTTISVGQATGCTITVSGWSGSVAGESVTITMLSGTGNIAPTSCTLSSGGTCAAAVVGTAVGTPTIQASYPSDGVNTFSSGSTQITIIQTTTVTHVNCVPASINVGTATTCIVTISNGYSPSGTVNWSTSGPGQFTPTTSCTLSSATCSIEYTPSGTGSPQITATYGGDANNFGGTGSFTLTVTQSTSGTLVLCTPQPVIVGLLATCTATVTGYLPTGTVAWTVTGSGNFSSNTCTLSGSPTAKCQVTFSPQSTSTVTATYNGDSNNLGSFGTFQVNAIVNRYLQFTVDNGGPAVTLTLTGCSVSPTTVVANGTAQIVHSDPGCGPITVTIPGYTGSTRYVGPGGVSTFTITSCSSGSCQVFASLIYYQLENIYQATPYYPTAWTAAGSVAVKGTWAGAPGTTVCTIQLAGGGGLATCQGWSDYMRPASLTDLVVSSNQRWSSVQVQYTDSTSNNVHNANYYFQFLEGFQFTLLGSAAAPSNPALSFTAYGTLSTFTLQTTLTRVWLDSSSGWTAQQLLTGSSLSERWATAASSGTVAAGENITVVYYHQFFEPLGYSVVSGPQGSSAPAVSLSLFGVQTKFQLTNQTTHLSSWADAGKTYNFTNPLTGSTSTARWYSQGASGTVSSSIGLTPVYFYQFGFSLGFTVIGGGQFIPPRINMTAFGTVGSAPLAQTSTTYWVDLNSAWTVNTLLSNATAGERWITNQQTSGTASGALSVSFRYYHQFQGKVVYQVLGGGTPAPPTLVYSAYGAAAQSVLSTSQASIWMDSATSWSVPPILNGTSPGERWIATTQTSGSATAAFSQGFSYKHQFFLKVKANTPLGGTFSDATNWYDSGAAVNLTALANGNWEFEFWNGTGPGSYNGTTIKPSFSVSGPITETAVYYPSIVITSSQGGSVRYACGSVTGVVKEGASATLYLPLGSTLAITANPSSILQVFQGWSGNVTSRTTQQSLQVAGPGSAAAAFALNTTGIAETVVGAAAVVAVVLASFVLRRKRINLRRRLPKRRESWLFTDTVLDSRTAKNLA